MKMRLQVFLLIPSLETLNFYVHTHIKKHTISLSLTHTYSPRTHTQTHTHVKKHIKSLSHAFTLFFCNSHTTSLTHTFSLFPVHKQNRTDDDENHKFIFLIKCRNGCPAFLLLSRRHLLNLFLFVFNFPNVIN
jgi:hypothetical protein